MAGAMWKLTDNKLYEERWEAVYSLGKTTQREDNRAKVIDIRNRS